MGHSSPVESRAVGHLRLPPRTSRLLVAPMSGELQVPAALLLVQVSAALLLVQVSVALLLVQAGLLPAATTGQLGVPPAQRLPVKSRP